jgi:hypothetical protein
MFTTDMELWINTWFMEQQNGKYTGTNMIDFQLMKKLAKDFNINKFMTQPTTQMHDGRCVEAITRKSTCVSDVYDTFRELKSDNIVLYVIDHHPSVPQHVGVNPPDYNPKILDEVLYTEEFWKVRYAVIPEVAINRKYFDEQLNQIYKQVNANVYYVIEEPNDLIKIKEVKSFKLNDEFDWLSLNHLNYIRTENGLPYFKA